MYTLSMSISPLVVWFSDIDLHETSRISKAGKHYGTLVQAGFPLLQGFVITQDAYFAFLKENNLEEKISQLLSTMNYNRPETLPQLMHHIKKHLTEASLPKSVVDHLASFYEHLNEYDLGIHAYTTATPSHKFATRAASDFDQLLATVKDTWTQHFEPNIHWKRHIHGHDHITTGVEILVQVETEPDKKGKIYTIDPHEHTKHVLHITHEHPHASDNYVLSKKTLMIHDRKLTHHNNAPKLTLDELLALGDLGKAVEKHLYFPQEITWGIINDIVFIHQTKPLNTLPKNRTEAKKKLPHTRGTAMTSTIGSGIVHIIHEASDLHKITDHDIIVIKDIHKDHITHLKKARGIISESGNKHTEVAVLIKQLGIPTLYQVKDATKRFKNGYAVTIHGGKGEVYIGGFQA